MTTTDDDHDEGPGLLASPAFWCAGAWCVLAWTVLWAVVTR